MKLLTYDNPDSKDYYEFLGLTKDAIIGDIRRAINFMLKLSHDDYGGNREQFNRLLEVKEILLDPVSRKIYDATGFGKKEIEVAAEEVAMALIELIPQVEDENTIKQALKVRYKELMNEVENNLEKIANDLVITQRTLDQLERTNLYMESIANVLEKRKTEILEVKVELDEKFKEINAKFILVKYLFLKKKTQSLDKFIVKTNGSSNATNSASWR